MGILSFLLPAAGWLFIKDSMYQAKKGTDYRYQLARFKNNGDVFAAMIRHQPAVARHPGDMGITIGHPKANNTLIKVCNPYCGPCAKAHPKIEELIDKNENWRVQIIFTASGDDEDQKTAPAAHMLAIADQKDETKTRKALDDWYNAEEKDYEQFAAKYPMNGEPDLQKEILKAMDTWCKEVGITHTPTFFVNGHELPGQYGIEDLKYI
ncbi:MAG TPA: thioredoxin domain-containing protein, partial [Balneolales bacterium]|nr:thioredoxin domain-containing protein [Balneolales bacterium]